MRDWQSGFAEAVRLCYRILDDACTPGKPPILPSQLIVQIKHAEKAGLEALPE